MVIFPKKIQRMRGNLFILLWLGCVVAQAKPEPEYWIRPDSLGLPYVEKRLKTPDGAELLSWLLPTQVRQPLHKTLVIAYAGTGNMANCVHYADAFLKAGFDVALFDYRGFGHSSAFRVDPNQIYYNEFVTDLQTAIRAAKTQFPTNRIGVLCFSMSTILTTFATHTEPVHFIVAEGFVSDLRAVVAYWRKAGPRTLRLPAGATAYPTAVRQLTVPMLLIAGTQDRITPLKSIANVAAQNRRRQLITFVGDHLQATQVWQQTTFADGFVRRITQFVATIRP